MSRTYRDMHRHAQAYRLRIERRRWRLLVAAWRMLCRAGRAGW